MEALDAEKAPPAAPGAAPRSRRDGAAAQLAVAAVVLLGGTALLTRVSPWTEALGATTGALCVWLAARSNFWTWPLGIANNVLYLIVFWGSRLYADALLQVVYAGISVYGLWRWRSGRGAAPVRPVERVGRAEAVWVAVLVVAAAIALAFVLDRHTDSDVPELDAATTAASLGAQWLMSRRRIENWWVWVAVDVVYVPLYVYKDLWVTAGLYAVFLALCVVGLRHWRTELAAERRA
jgi:nicotinamide mononucleotide transporter